MIENKHLYERVQFSIFKKMSVAKRGALWMFCERIAMLVTAIAAFTILVSLIAQNWPLPK